MTRSLPRVVFVTRRFWPLLGGAETVVANLSAALVARGGEATVVTAQSLSENRLKESAAADFAPRTPQKGTVPGGSWPAEIVHRSVRVVRLPQASARVWGTLGYLRQLARWLRENREQFDLVVASQLKHDAYVAVRCGRRLGFPVVLRASGAGATGDCHWHTVGRCGMRIRRTVMQAAAVVAPSPAIEAELLAAGFSAERVATILSGVPAAPAPSIDRQARARDTLAAANPMLALPAGTKMAVYTGRFHAAKGLAELVTAWREVAERQRRAYLWMVGDGPERDALAAQIEAAGLSGRVELAGSFDQVENILAAADLFVLPSHEEGLSLALLEAMGAGLPVVASDIPGNRLAIRSGIEGLLVPVGNPADLAAAINDLLSDPARSAAFGAAARSRVQESFSLDRMVDDYLALFDRVLNSARTVHG